MPDRIQLGRRGVAYPPPWTVRVSRTRDGWQRIAVGTGGTIADTEDGVPVPDDLTLLFPLGPELLLPSGHLTLAGERRTAMRAIAVVMAGVLHEGMEWTRLADPHPPGESYDWLAKRIERLVLDYVRSFPLVVEVADG